MADREIIVTDGGGSGVGIMLGIILGTIIILGVLYFSGALGKIIGGKDTKIDVNIQQPSAPKAP